MTFFAFTLNRLLFRTYLPRYAWTCIIIKTNEPTTHPPMLGKNNSLNLVNYWCFNMSDVRLWLIGFKCVTSFKYIPYFTCDFLFFLF